jgi:type VI secretion system secreted protein Hcp
MAEGPSFAELSQHIGYVQFDGIKGESQDSKHKDWVKVLAISERIERPVGGTAGSLRSHERATVGDVVIIKEVDKSSPPLYEHACDGKHIPKVVIELTTSVGAGHDATFFKYTLENVIVSKVAMKTDTGLTRATEEVSLNFQKIKWEYTPYDKAGKAQGNVPAGWDVMENRKH